MREDFSAKGRVMAAAARKNPLIPAGTVALPFAVAIVGLFLGITLLAGGAMSVLGTILTGDQSGDKIAKDLLE
jgi:hypothetical protein